ncbi:MAG: lysoplasmalogenase [Clostridia bacterium]|nr:lysoplasmalogenase [Clostridia bacterium]
MTLEKKSIILNIILAILILIADVLYITVPCSPYITKTIASSLFVVMGVINFILMVKNDKQQFYFGLFLLMGLIFACSGDILLIDVFVIGASFFGLGHIFFFLAFCFLNGFKVKDFVCGAIIFILSFLLIEFYKGFNFGGLKILVVVYALIISIMLGKATMGVFEKNNKWINIVIFVGAFLLFFSDLMLVLYMFAGRKLVFDILCLCSYYPAEAILAFSIFATSFHFKKLTQRKKLTNI